MKKKKTFSRHFLQQSRTKRVNNNNTRMIYGGRRCVRDTKRSVFTRILNIYSNDDDDDDDENMRFRDFYLYKTYHTRGVRIDFFISRTARVKREEFSIRIAYIVRRTRALRL